MSDDPKNEALLGRVLEFLEVLEDPSEGPGAELARFDSRMKSKVSHSLMAHSLAQQIRMVLPEPEGPDPRQVDLFSDGT